jgi:hypothetical protein
MSDSKKQPNNNKVVKPKEKCAKDIATLGKFETQRDSYSYQRRKMKRITGRRKGVLMKK